MNLLVLNLDYAFDRGAWHGTTLRGALRGLKPATALFRPAPDRHNIWEYVLHAAYWKYIARRRLADGPKFPRRPSDWPRVPDDPTAKALKADLELLTEEHDRLRAGVAKFPARRLADRPTEKGPTYAQLILGVAAHDLYHTGQIQLLKRLAP